MATYAIGDIQGCFRAFTSLLTEIKFDKNHDRLWICGDLVNRGPKSAAVLRFVRDLGDRAVTILGNHDLNLLAVAAGTRTLRKKDTCQDILSAPDRDQLIHWLRHLPLIHHDAELGFTLVHAGIYPGWDRETAARCAREVEAVLQNDNEWTAFVANMYGNEPAHWSEDLSGWDRLRFTTNTLTRLRYCYEDGAVELHHAGQPGTQEPNLTPWFQFPGRRSQGEAIVFGHWATLVLQPPPPPSSHARSETGTGTDKNSKQPPRIWDDLFEFFTSLHTQHAVYPLDTGCVWGSRLAALRLEDRQYFSVACRK